MRICSIGLSAVALVLSAAQADEGNHRMVHHAHGSFEVRVLPGAPGPAEGLSRFTLDKEIHGDLEATSHGEMIAGGDNTKGEAGYVAIERVSGALAGLKGSFALQHNATMTQAGSAMQVVVVPGSGTGQLTGIDGTFKIIIEGGSHRYEFDYTLP